MRYTVGDMIGAGWDGACPPASCLLCQPSLGEGKRQSRAKQGKAGQALDLQPSETAGSCRQKYRGTAPGVKSVSQSQVASTCCRCKAKYLWPLVLGLLASSIGDPCVLGTPPSRPRFKIHIKPSVLSARASVLFTAGFKLVSFTNPGAAKCHTPGS